MQIIPYVRRIICSAVPGFGPVARALPVHFLSHDRSMYALVCTQDRMSTIVPRELGEAARVNVEEGGEGGGGMVIEVGG